MIFKNLEKYKNIVNSWLPTYLPTKSIFAKEILEGMKYILLSEGKRIRPILNLLGGQIVDLNIENFKSFACGIEYIHTYSLVHDDLPSMDNDELRRGKKTCHKIYGEGQAILIGDCLFSTGISLLLNPLKNISYENQIKASKELIDSLGFYGMIAGQSEDIKNKKTINQNKLIKIYKYKTCKLITSSLVSGALLGGNNKKIINDLIIFGNAFGLAFQITDDMLDMISMTKELRKNNDITKNKLTYPLLYGTKKSNKKIKNEIEKACESVKNYGIYGNILQNIAKYLINRRV